MAKIVIIGAGLTGLSTAYHLEKQNFYDYRIFEKEASVGGLCRSITDAGFTFDFTGHLLHINDAYFNSFINTLYGIDNFNVINRRSFIYSHNTYTHYPFQINLHGLPTEVIAECIAGYVSRPNQKKEPSFYQWVLQNFGKGFGKHFFFPYQKKIFAYDIKRISASWTGRFVPATSLMHIINGALQYPEQEQGIGYNAQFFYPKKGGIVAWVEQIANHLSNAVALNHCVKKIDARTKSIHFTNGHVEHYEQLITTMPLDRLLNNLQEPAHSSCAAAQRHLRCNQVVNFNLGIARPDVSNAHWVYFPEIEYPFYRLGFPHNFSHHSVPDGCSSLYGEFSFLQKPKQWINQTLHAALDTTKTLLGISNSDIITQQILHIPHAYVTYNFWRERNLPKLLKQLEALNIYSVGRYGAWKYASMQEAVLDGKAVAEQIITHL